MNPVEAEVRDWLERIVIGLDLCPFAARPFRTGRVRVQVSEARDELALLTDLQLALTDLDQTPSAAVETAIIAIPHLLADFDDYNDFLDQVDALLEQFEWTGEYQVASFHPQYRFEDTHPDDAANLSNRSPVPLLHLLREDSVEAAVHHHPDVDGIPHANIRKLRALTPAQRRALFGNR